MLGSAPVVANVPAVDLQRARSFYADKLGLKELGGMPDGAMFEAGQGSKIFIYERPEATKAEHTAASFKVDDVLAAVKALKAKGVTFESYDMGELKTDADNIARMGDLQASWFKDTEGNILCVANM
jgi:catechol 2,3-dioxygenase-like lactoylglutathione lyase family enzyme